MKLTAAYSDQEHPLFPMLPLTLRDLLNEHRTELSAKVDTGFAGGLLLPLSLYMELQLYLSERAEGEIHGRLVTGASVPLRVALAVAQLGSIEIECEVYTSPYPVRPLIGRALLNRWITTLNGPAARLEVAIRPDVK